MKPLKQFLDTESVRFNKMFKICEASQASINVFSDLDRVDERLPSGIRTRSYDRISYRREREKGLDDEGKQGGS